jgi:hypothetical protein
MTSFWKFGARACSQGNPSLGAPGNQEAQGNTTRPKPETRGDQLPSRNRNRVVKPAHLKYAFGCNSVTCGKSRELYGVYAGLLKSAPAIASRLNETIEP